MQPVVEIGKGSEVAQLDGSARQWNASADESGQLALRRRRAPVAPAPRSG